MKAKIYCLFLLLYVITGCSTSRNTRLSRTYHDINTYYNVYFNGRETLKQASKKVEKIEPQSFDEILPVFAFEYEQAPGLVSGDMQRVMDKGAKSIQKHSITVKPKRKRNMTPQQREFYNKKEFNKYIDDAQLTIGQAHAYLHEFGSATEKFAFMQTEYPKENTIYDAQAWQAIALAQDKEYAQAEELLVSLTRKQNVPYKSEPIINAALADLYIKQNKYAEAIPHLEKALKRARNKDTKIRYHYILGQLYQKTSNNSKSLEHFQKVLKKNPPYLTAFNAEMAMAFAYDPATQKGNIRKILERALKNEQNANYHDQIYYAFAKLEESENNIEKALEYYHKSLETTGGSARQKGLSALALAEYYIKQNDYINAYKYYESAVNNLGANHSLYEETVKNATKYRKIALNMQVIQHEDSLQKLATLSDRELTNLLEDKARAAEEEQKKREDAQKQLEKIQSDIQAQSAQGTWYFYNPASIKLGKTDFEMRWGSRKLEDNWRRKNRGIQIQQEYDDEWEIPEAETSLSVNNTSTADIDEIKKSIPKTDEAKTVSDEKVAYAMFNVAEAYRDDLNNLTKSAEEFEMLNSRFPQNTYQADSYVALYDIYSKTGNTDKANYYKNLMQQKYPDNRKVKAAINPSYINTLANLEATEEADYSAALNLYATNQLRGANAAATSALSKYPEGRLKPQFELLKVLTDNYNGNVVQYRAALNGIISKYKGNMAADYAQGVLNELEKHQLEWGNAIAEQPKEVTQQGTQTPARQPETTQQKPTEPATPVQGVKINYSTADGEQSFVVVTEKFVDTKRLQFYITEFNANNYLQENYDVQIVDFANYRMIIVSKMKDKKAALDYYRKINESDIFKGIGANDFASFVILNTNLTEMRKGTNFTDYMEFFNNNYLN